MYCLQSTVVWKLKPCSVCLPSLSVKGGSVAERDGDWKEEPVHKQLSLQPVKLTNSDRQLTHSYKPRSVSGAKLWQEAAHPLINA